MKRNLLKITSVAMLLLIVAIGCKKENSVTGVSLDKTNITLSVDETVTLTATVQPNDAANQSVSWTSSDPLVATVSNGIVNAKKTGTATITVTTAEGNYTAKCTVTVTSKGIDINGITWATCNVATPGTFAAKPEDAGMFYQWNRKKGWSATGDVTDWDTTIPAGDTWEKENDPCPAGWRVPNRKELESLLSSDSTWGERNGITGLFFGAGEESLFLPAAGIRSYSDGTLNGTGNAGIYWSSANYGSQYAISLYFTNEEALMYYNYRRYGLSVRCVAE